MGVILLNVLLLFFYALGVRLFSLNKNDQMFLFLSIAFIHLMFMHTFFDISLFPDLEGYLTYFNNISSPQLNFEIGWYWLNRSLHCISHNSFILIFFVSLVMIVCYLITIKRYSAIAWMSVFLLLSTVFYDSLFVLRQNLAIPICLMTIPFIVDRKPIYFALITLLAVSFHYSAIVWFFTYFIYPIKVNLGFYLGIIVVTILAYLLMDIILSKVTMLTSNIKAYTVSNSSGGTGALKIAAVNASTIILSLYAFKNHNSFKEYNKLFFQLVVIALFLNIIDYLGTSFILFSRLNLYFTVSGMLLIPNALVRVKDKRLQYILIPLICVCYLILLQSIAQYGYEF